MKQNFIIIFMLLLSVVLFSHCAKDALMYDEPAAIYFEKTGVSPDSVNYTFGVRPPQITTDTVYLKMRIMGLAASTDREIKLELAPGATAKMGYHFKLGPLIMPANKYQASIPVYLFRKAGLKDSILSATFHVVESKDFKPGYPDIVSNSVKSRLEYKIRLDDQINKPAGWDANLATYFGAFSVVKYQFMIEVTGKIDWGPQIPDGERNFLIGEVKLALYNYEQKNGPLLDEKGTTVTFP